ncbi:hypothetical protein [Synechococcus sp. CS-197]|uniref:hypothetical protein n=1 Tax=Synechococcus sp. CS-197 TaxID=2847985 RepID=UPI00015255A5|nr:hypothetical protein [Synechococcus sp. CS-197]MCT0251812.1 hypothetical protein [Synechococcus sp. CS-197]PTT97085.1 hypothetical protein DBR45_40370 [Pseudomonas sp. HMWF031]CAK23381.1 Conserved hypothetical protein [Synechococcus sp. WH 7803]
MSKATKLLMALDRVLLAIDDFGDDPLSEIDAVLTRLEPDIQQVEIRGRDKHQAEIYVARDRASVKVEVLNRVMERCHQKR